ncbi:MAG: sugar nucleotide-binding protein [bacterium]|nr:sugar nucleotide-binding protein [Candidatus Kapabacteria bacterium]
MEAVTRDRDVSAEHERPAIWGGVECTVNRVGDEYFDQIERSGHAARLDDLRAIADLGIRTLRFPLLWERTAPDGLASASWDWADERMELMRELGINPIVGLVHHGSGPRSTSLLDPHFAEKLADYGRAVAERYPWVTSYTPVNEPLTTARFSGLYGLWYPHMRDDHSFSHALMNQCRATVLAMRAVREVNPEAILVQTEDLGRTHSTAALRYQARFENHRRWITFDLLAGTVDESHPLWKYLNYYLQNDGELAWMRDNPTPPGILGLNYYVTSERFLDERISRYPDCEAGGNQKQRYVDVEAVRVLAEGVDGPERLIGEAWDRYHIPIAVTEAHLGCGRAEQLRWFREIYDACVRLRARDVDVRAVTAWAMLGTFDWNSLVTRCEGVYEPGLFDVRGGSLRPTALARMVSEMIAGSDSVHPLASQPGWWKRPSRLLYIPVDRYRQSLAIDINLDEPPSIANADALIHAVFRLGVSENDTTSRPLVITGATGLLGRAFAHQCKVRGIPFRLLARCDVDIANRDTVEIALARLNPWAVVNAAGFVRVDDAEIDSARCYRDNTYGAMTLASVCAARDIPFVTFSSDLVFDGMSSRPYVESDRTAALSTYGRSKADAETQVTAVHPRALIIRTSAFFGPVDEHNYVTRTLRSLAEGNPAIVADDATVSPTYVPDLVEETLNLLIDDERGIWHLSNEGAVTWFELAHEAARRAGIDTALLIGRPTAELGYRAQRPMYSALATERGQRLPTLENALARYMNESSVTTDKILQWQ